MAIPGNFLSPTTESVDPNTSGWAAKMNATVSLGSGGRNGDGCLKLASVVAGEMQARTVSSYPVTAGTVYFAFADASSAAVGERIGIRWLNASGGEVGVAYSGTTTTASASWHRVSTAGAAPPGTTKAQVILSSPETGAGALHYWENVYLGLPIRTIGNLFPFNSETPEVDASGWTVLANATLIRQVPMFSWPVDYYLAGGHVLTMTVGAAGNASIGAVDRPPVTVGTEYEAYAYLSPPTIGSTAWIELRFYNAAGTQVQATRSTLAPPGVNMYRQRVSAVAPAGAASASVAVGLDGASAGQVLRADGVVIQAAPVLQSGTVLPLADASFEQGIGPWTTASGVATMARTTPWGTGFLGSYALAITSSTASASVVRSGRYPLIGNSIGQNWRALINTHIGAGTWGPVGVRIRWYDAADTDLGATTAFEATLPGADWYSLYREAPAPEGATQAAIEVTVTATSAASVLHVDSTALWPFLPLTDLEAHSDGGYITLTLRELPLDNTVSVYRVGADGSRSLVRGSSGLIDHQSIVSDLLVVEDHEAPLGVPVSYQVELYPPGGGIATRLTPEATLVHDDPNLVWLKDPGNPQRNLMVMVQQAPDWERPIEQAVHVVRGRRNKVVLSGSRQGLEGDLAIWTRSDDERRALHLLLDSGNTLLWQAAPGMGVDDMYVNVAAVPEARIGGPAQEVWRSWTLPLTEADMPVTTGVNGSGGRTWTDVAAEFATCADLLPVYATCEALLLDRRTG